MQKGKATLNILQIKQECALHLFKKENIIKENDIDILSIIEKYLINLYTLKLNIIYFIAEKDQFFSAYLSIEEDKLLEAKKKRYN